VDGFVVQDHQLLDFDRRHGLGTALVISERDLVHSGFPPVDDHT